MKYRFSFTGASAMIPEFTTLAQQIQNGFTLDEIDTKVAGREKYETNSREFRELKHRIKTLTPAQIEILADGDPTERNQITHLALCKTYGIYHDFVTEVLSEKIQVFDDSLTEMDYNSFISKKKMGHPELDRLAESTQKKVKQVIIKMLQQVGIIDSISNPSILPQTVHSKVENAIIEDHPKWLACFLYNEHQIETLL
ncbi:DUF1819 family protein [Rhodohalobacter sp. WB101]|uniref:DUF1819 family protein n=1 Tax=Rhodohalobacter sulfatireducens TaxID=2911366 RepID=A0ABS9KAA1_9BACT|nr:DUF1819 family protein [Rhodohalobacter sulfatireducens]